ncbi:hypothetical protein [Vibrio chagasii]|uniref:hypothetical protein n=1 Tax=Vibrio chagasii TaxID=170679 RepID=UPI003DA01EE5
MTKLALLQVSDSVKAWLFSKHWLFVLAMLIYLALESSFHAILTSTVIDPAASIADIHRVEIYGRLISGFGSGLLLTRFVLTKLPKPTNCFGKVLIFSSIFSAVYFGQKALVEHFLIEPSSAEVRRDALLVNTVKTGLYNQDLLTKSLTFSDSVKEDVEQKVMLSLLSAGFLYNENFKDSAMNQLQSILLSIASSRYTSVFHSEILPKFDSSRHDVNALFSDYGHAHKERDNNLKDSVIKRKWRQIYDEASTEYVRKDILTQLEKAGYSLRNKRVNREYEANVDRSLVELQRYANENGNSKLTRGSAKRFIQKAQQPYSDLNRQLQDELDLPKGSFQLDPPYVARAWLKHAMITGFEAELNNKLSQSGITRMKPNIRRFSEFEKHPDIQDKAREALGDYYVKGFSFNWSDAQLYASLRETFIDTQVTSMRNNIEGELSSFKDGGELENAGKDALRAILIPCIALVLSVILSVTSVVKLVSMALVGLSDAISKRIRVSRDFSLKSQFLQEVTLLVKPLIILVVVLIVLNAPLIIGWHEEVQSILSRHSPITYNFVNALTPLIHAMLVFVDRIFYWCLGGYLLYRLFHYARSYRLIIKHGDRWRRIPTKLLNFRTSLNILWFIIFVCLPLLYLVRHPLDAQATQIAYASYEWLLSVQPIVYSQGEFLNDVASLPNMVDSITAHLKHLDARLWADYPSPTITNSAS